MAYGFNEEQAELIATQEKEKDFDILITENIEIQKYYFDFIKQSIYLLKKQNYIGLFDLPLHVRNYLLFTGVYGKEINKINLLESDFVYQNEEN